jgi:bacterioferritin-associated ferredoxin
MGRPRTWTDDDLRDALHDATSWSDVCRRLGLGTSGGNLNCVRERCEALELDTSQLPAPGAAPRTWTDQQLREAVRSARNLNGVFRHLGLAVGGSAWRRMQDHIERLGLDTSHWDAGRWQPGGARTRRPRVHVDDGALRVAVVGARSVAEVVRRLGFETTSGTVHRRVRDRIQELEIADDSLRGQAWSRGTRRDRRSVPLEEVLVPGSSYRGGSVRLRRRLVDAGLLEERCAICGLEMWRGEPAPLELDHVDGDPRNQTLGNLRLLCPNCHAQTPTYCGRNIARG